MKTPRTVATTKRALSQQLNRAFSPGFGYSLYRMYHPNEGRWMTTDPVRGKREPLSIRTEQPSDVYRPSWDRFSGHICQSGRRSWIPWSIVRGECVSVGRNGCRAGIPGNLRFLSGERARVRRQICSSSPVAFGEMRQTLYAVLNRRSTRLKA